MPVYRTKRFEMRLGLFSLNCRGLRNNLKRKYIFNLCKNYHIAFLQETFITDDISYAWKKQWQGNFFHHKGSTNSQGLITLLNKKLTLDSDPVILLSDERIMALKIYYDCSSLVIINIYAPNKKQQKIIFFNKLHNFISSLHNEPNIIISGDFNTVLNNELDILSGLPHDSSEVNVFKNLLLDHCLVDTWRAFHFDNKDFTWCKSSIARRLDYLLCNENCIHLISKVEHLIVSCSDHKAIIADLNDINFKRGPSTWQINNSLLTDPTYIADINNIIENFITNSTSSSPQRNWELLKSEIKSYSIQFSSVKNRTLKLNYNNTLKEINRVSALLVEYPNCPILNKEFSTLKLQQELHDLNKTKGAQIRSRLKYIEEGEKNTKYFLDLEKARGANNTIFELDTKNGNIVDPLLIINEIKAFYSDLYKKDENINDSYDSLKSFFKF